MEDVPVVDPPVVEEDVPNIDPPVIEEDVPNIDPPVIEEDLPNIDLPVIEEDLPILDDILEEDLPNVNDILEEDLPILDENLPIIDDFPILDEDLPLIVEEETEEGGEVYFEEAPVFTAATASRTLQSFAGASAIAVALNHPSVGYSAFVVSIIGRFLYYIKYLDVEWPANLQYFFEIYELRSLIPLMDPPSGLKGQTDEDNYTVDYSFR